MDTWARKVRKRENRMVTLAETPKESKSDRFVSIISQLAGLQNEIENGVEVFHGYKAMLFEPILIFRYRKDCNVVWMASRLMQAYLKSDTAVVNGFLKAIRSRDSEFAMKISRIIPSSGSNKIFEELLKVYQQNKSKFMPYIKTHFQELATAARSLEDDKLSKELVLLLSVISRHELEYISRYNEECRAWVALPYARYPIEFFVRRIDLFLKGGFDNEVEFKGMYKDFGDTNLAGFITKNSAVKNLWRYGHQIEYIKKLISLCVKSEKSGSWEGFYGQEGFWGKEGDKKGKNFDRYAKNFEGVYGNFDFAAMLESEKDKIGENPEAWGGIWQGSKLLKDGFLPQLLRKLQDPAYQRQMIIAPASAELQKAFTQREKELAAEIDHHVQRLVNLLSAIIGTGASKRKVLLALKRLMIKKSRKSLKDIEEDIAHFFKVADKPISRYMDYKSAFDRIWSKIDPKLLRENMQKLGDRSVLNLRYTYTQVSGEACLQNFMDYMRTEAAANAANEAWKRRRAIESLEYLSDDEFAQLRNLLTEAIGVLALLREVSIKTQRQIALRYFAPSGSISIDLGKIKNQKFEFDKVKAAFGSLYG